MLHSAMDDLRSVATFSKPTVGTALLAHLLAEVLETFLSSWLESACLARGGVNITIQEDATR